MQNQLANRRVALAACGAFFLSLLCGSLALRADHESGHEAVLFNGKDLTGWKLRNPDAKDTWVVVSDVKLDPADPKKLAGSGSGGNEHGVLFRQPVAHGSDLITEKTFGDCELHIEFMVPRGSNSGVYLMGEYEVQIFDSFGKQKVAPSDCGGIYITKAPSENASKAPGEWQTFDITFRAPRFDAGGKKTENAKFIKVVHNGKTIHENVEAPKPTGSELPGGEKKVGPLFLQGDHGIVAFRNIRITPMDVK
jgi:hypothetical protein